MNFRRSINLLHLATNDLAINDFSDYWHEFHTLRLSIVLLVAKLLKHFRISDSL